MIQLLSSSLSQLSVALGILSMALAAPATYEVLPPTSVLGHPGASSTSSGLITHPGANNDGITEDNVWGILDDLALCESGGNPKAINPKDVDGRPKFGTFQFDSRTWVWMSKAAGVDGDPMNRNDALKVTKWALLNGYSGHWGCFQKVWSK